MLLSYGAVMALMLPFGVWITWFASDALATSKVAPGSGPFAVLGIVVGVVAIGLSCWALPLLLRPSLTVAGDTLRICRPFRSARIPVDDVDGVGLVFRRSLVPGRGSRAPGWYLMVWHGKVEGELIAAICFTPTLRSLHDPRGWQKFLALPPAAPAFGEVPRFSIDSFDPALLTDPAKLANTHAGRVARDIYDRVLERQGPAGRLALIEQQNHALAGQQQDSERSLAFWSPTGTIGRTEAHPPDRTP